MLPFNVNKEQQTLNCLLTSNDGSLVHCQIADTKNLSLNIHATSPSTLSVSRCNILQQQLASSLRLTEDYSEFYKVAKNFPQYSWIAKMKAGRMLRSPTVFEDVVKMICTTNCSWSLTEIMVENLVGELGKPFNESLRSFPSPEALAGSTEQFLRKNVKAGYRSPFLLEFAKNVASGKLDVERWRSSDLPTNDLFQELRSIKGVGEYAAGNILKLLGRYDYLGLDSWVRGKYFELYHKGRKVCDKTIERRYAPLGKWRGLFFWMEMTKHWYKDKFPF